MGAQDKLAAVEASGGVALLVIDMLSQWEFPDGETLVGEAEAIASRIVALKQRCTAAGVPTIYVNDNVGHWRSDLTQLIAAVTADGSRGSRIARRLAPGPEDYVVLKPKHSAFHATPLELLLRELRADRLVLTGVSSDQCVLYTAADAKMRDLEIAIPCDCTATLSGERHRLAVRHLGDVLGVSTTAAETLGDHLPIERLFSPAAPSQAG